MCQKRAAAHAVLVCAQAVGSSSHGVYCQKMPQKKLNVLLKKSQSLSGVIKKKILNGLGFGKVKLAASGRLHRFLMMC